MGGHILDLVLARPDENLMNNCVVGVRLSDHHFLCFDLLHKKPEFQKEEVVIRNFKKINVFEFQKDMKSQFDEIMGLECVEHLTETF